MQHITEITDDVRRRIERSEEAGRDADAARRKADEIRRDRQGGRS